MRSPVPKRTSIEVSSVSSDLSIGLPKTRPRRPSLTLGGIQRASPQLGLTSSATIPPLLQLPFTAGNIDAERRLKNTLLELEAFILREFLPRSASGAGHLLCEPEDEVIEATPQSACSFTGMVDDIGDGTTESSSAPRPRLVMANRSVSFKNEGHDAASKDGNDADAQVKFSLDDVAPNESLYSLNQFQAVTGQHGSEEDSPKKRSGSKVVGSQRRQNFLKEVVCTFKKSEFSSELAKEKGNISDSNGVIMDSLFSLVIVLNALSIGISTDVVPEWDGWLVVDAIFAVLFTVEMVLKLVIQKRKYFTGVDRWWNLFEAGMVAFGIFECVVAVAARLTSGTSGTESSNLALLRILRLARISRLLRVCRMPLFTELKIMIQGAFGGCRTLLWSTVLICLPLYAASIFYRETLGVNAWAGSGAQMFSSVPMAFFTLFRCTVSNECSDENGRPIFHHIAAGYGWAFSLSFCCLELFMVFGLFNVIVAIFIENVLASAKTNDLVMQRERLRNKNYFAQKMMDFVTEVAKAKVECPQDFVDDDDEVNENDPLRMSLTPESMDKVLKRPVIVEIIRDLDLAEADLVNIVEVLDIDGSGTIDMAELFEGISRLRGQPSRSDVVGLSFMLEQVQEDLWEQREQLFLMQGQIQHALRSDRVCDISNLRSFAQ